MTAGLRQRIDVIRMNQANDEDMGGAVYTGTCVYTLLPAKLLARMPSQIALEQGLEVDAIWDGTVQAKRFGRMVTIIPRDQVKIVSPFSDPFFERRFRVTGVRHSQHRRGGGGYLHLTLSRIDESRTDTIR